MTVETRLSLVSLQRMGACNHATSAFQERFPQGATLREVILALADYPQGINWFEWLATRLPELRQLWEQYDAAKRQLWEQYEAAKRPLREQYDAAEHQLWEQYVIAAKHQLWEQYDAAKRSSLRVIAEAFSLPATDKEET